jgi:hypothetical protein
LDPKFADAVEGLHGSFERLLAMQPVRDSQLPASMPKRGVYLFSEGNKHFYVGRSNRLRARYKLQCYPSAVESTAAFAFKLAREATGKLKASYKRGAESRAGLMSDPTFAAAFDQAKVRIRSMDYRYVEEADPTRQALLEMYCAIALGTPYNDFDNH